MVEAIEYYYGISVFVRYILSVLVDDASVCRAANTWDPLNECPSVQDVSTVFIWDIGLNIRSKKNPDGISKGWLVCFSEQERGLGQSWWVAA